MIKKLLILSVVALGLTACDPKVYNASYETCMNDMVNNPIYTNREKHNMCTEYAKNNYYKGGSK